MTGIQNTEFDGKNLSEKKPSAPEIYKTLGNSIRSIRDSRKESRKKFCSVLNSASKAPVDKNGYKMELKEDTLKKWETGENQVSILWLPAICEIAGCDYSFLFGESECRTRDLQGVVDFTGLSAEAIELLSGLSNDPDGIEIVREIDSLINDRRIIRRLHDVRKVSEGIIHSAPSLDSISALRGMLEIALLDLSTQVHVYASDSLNAEEAKSKLSRMEKPERKKWVY